MATFRFSCPSCRRQLEIDERHAGQEVECGHCYHIFLAPRVEPRSDRGSRGDEGYFTARRPSRIPDELWEEQRPRRRPRYVDDDDDWAPPSSRPGSESDALAIIALVLGGVSLPMACCCWPLGLATSLGAIITSIFGLKSAKNQVMAILGLIFGVLALGLVAFAMLLGFGNMILNG
ncbi:MAG: hypothetical protein RMJ56_12910 [Gemmataceae bacterium]|nr:hypothetical protein [Gemmata sp.]MDW8198495.1 hypothetical protein [Gemmataceae bacterium]